MVFFLGVVLFLRWSYGRFRLYYLGDAVFPLSDPASVVDVPVTSNPAAYPPSAGRSVGATPPHQAGGDNTGFGG